MPKKKNPKLSKQVLDRLDDFELDASSLAGWLKVVEAIELCKKSDRHFRRLLREEPETYRSRGDLDMLRVWWKDVPVPLEADELGAPE